MRALATARTALNAILADATPTEAQGQAVVGPLVPGADYGFSHLFADVAGGSSDAFLAANMPDPPAVCVANPTVRFYATDFKGSVVQTFDTNARACKLRSFEPFGTEQATAAPPNPAANDADDLRYLGARRDPSGLYHLGARYYDPAFGRFLQPDPLVGDPQNPQDYNRYAYARNNPVRYADPTGLAAFNIGFGFSFGGDSGFRFSGISFSFGGRSRSRRRAARREAFRDFGRVFGFGALGGLGGGRGPLGFPSRRSSIQLATPPFVPSNSFLSWGGGEESGGGGGSIFGTIADIAGYVSYIPGLNVAATLVEIGARLVDGDVSAALEASVGFIPGGKILKAVGKHGRRVVAGIGEGRNAVAGASRAARATGIGVGEHAGKSVRARSPKRNFTRKERAEINEAGEQTGCHTCGSRNPRTRSRNYIPDHQPPSSLNAGGGPQDLYPQCLHCSNRQGGLISQELRRQRSE